jgi:hypothetical protein
MPETPLLARRGNTCQQIYQPSEHGSAPHHCGGAMWGIIGHPCAQAAWMFSISRSQKHEVDNLTGKNFYETQNYFESRTSPSADAKERIHGTPGYPFGITVGVTFRIGEK